MTDTKRPREFWLNPSTNGNMYYAWRNKQNSNNPNFEQILVREVLEDGPDLIAKYMHEKALAQDECRKWIDLATELAEALEHNTSEFAHDLALKNEALARYRELVEEKK